MTDEKQIARVRTIATQVYRALNRFGDAEQMTDEQRTQLARELRSILADAQIVDAFAFNDLVWRWLREAYDDVELNQTFLEVWSPAESETA